MRTGQRTKTEAYTGKVRVCEEGVTFRDATKDELVVAYGEGSAKLFGHLRIQKVRESRVVHTVYARVL